MQVHATVLPAVPRLASTHLHLDPGEIFNVGSIVSIAEELSRNLF